MRINDILTESAIQELHEGPMLNKIGTGIGKAVGTAGKAIGAVAGGAAGALDAAKKGFAAGRSAVAGAGDEPAPTTAGAINKAGPKGTAAAKQQTGAAAQAINKTAQATAGASPEQAGQTLYAQVKSQVNQLDKKGKQRILQLLQKSLAAPAPAAQPAANPAAQPAAGSTQAAAPASAATDANASSAVGSKFTWGTVDGKPEVWTKTAKGWQSGISGATADGSYGQQIEKAYKQQATNKKPAAPSQAEIDADREARMGKFTDSVERHKQRMVAESIANGTFTIFKK
jgi:hypothetical protein